MQKRNFFDSRLLYEFLHSRLDAWFVNSPMTVKTRSSSGAGDAPLSFARPSKVPIHPNVFIAKRNPRTRLPPLQYCRRHDCRLTIVRRNRTAVSKIADHQRYRLSRLQACESRNSQSARAKPFSSRPPECIKV